MDLDMAREFLAATAKKKQLNAELKETQGEIDELSLELGRQFEREGMQNITLDGHQVYLKPVFYVKGEAAVLVPTLREIGMPEMVTESVPNQTLRAYVTEQAATMAVDQKIEDVLPPELAAVLEVTKVFKVQAKKAQTKKGGR